MKLPPQIFHLVEEENWPSIERSGLLSAKELMLRSGASGLLDSYRSQRTVLPDGTVIRDQKPMPPKALESCLVGMRPLDWYRLLNSKIFFWLDRDRLDRQRKACGNHPQKVLTIETQRLLKQYAHCASVTPINTGNARRKPALRSGNTFVPYPIWLESGWAHEAIKLGKAPRPRSHHPIELTLDKSVPNIMEFVIGVTDSDGEPSICR